MDSKLFLGGGGQSLHGATLYAHAPLQACINKQEYSFMNWCSKWFETVYQPIIVNTTNIPWFMGVIYTTTQLPLLWHQLMMFDPSVLTITAIGTYWKLKHLITQSRNTLNSLTRIKFFITHFWSAVKLNMRTNYQWTNYNLLTHQSSHRGTVSEWVEGSRALR